jgi:hypothetical protein
LDAVLARKSDNAKFASVAKMQCSEAVWGRKKRSFSTQKTKPELPVVGVKRIAVVEPRGWLNDGAKDRAVQTFRIMQFAFAQGVYQPACAARNVFPQWGRLSCPEGTAGPNELPEGKSSGSAKSSPNRSAMRKHR